MSEESKRMVSVVKEHKNPKRKEKKRHAVETRNPRFWGQGGELYKGSFYYKRERKRRVARTNQ